MHIELTIGEVTCQSPPGPSRGTGWLAGDANPGPLGGPALAYTFLRHTGFLLDELSAEGLLLWLDENGHFDRLSASCWQWRWQTTPLQSDNGFWAMGEALVDAVATRYPAAFAPPTAVEFE